MLTRGILQGSLVALQILPKGTTSCNRERSHSIDDTTASSSIDQRQIGVGENHSQQQAAHFQFSHVPVGYRSWVTKAPTVVTNNVPEQDVPEEIISTHDFVADDTPTATYHYGSREWVVQLVCHFLEIWLDSTRHETVNPHGWECLRRTRALQEGVPQNSTNSYNQNIAHASCGHSHHYLYGTTIPTIAMKDYLMRLTEYFRTSDATFILATHYFSRVVEAHDRKQALLPPELQTQIITPWSLHRIYFTCCVLAAKWLEDTPFDNQYYASVGGISTFELNKVETALLSLLDFNIFVSRKTVDKSWESLSDLYAGAPVCPSLAVPSVSYSSFVTQSSAPTFSTRGLSVSATPYRPVPSCSTGTWHRVQPQFFYQ